VIPVVYSREQLVTMLRRAGLPDAAADADATLPEEVPAKDVEQFCTAHGLSLSSMTDRMGGSP